MGTRKCGCIYADTKNTPAVRSEREMGGYLKQACPLHSTKRPIREHLFRGWPGCSNHDCIVTGNKNGMATNGLCKCLVNASRGQLQILQSRLKTLLNETD